MMKDKYQKQKLIEYFISKDWYPQLEVDVIYSNTTLQKPKMITDIDVLAMSPSVNGILQPLIGDCKTLKNQSPINRVFWIKGLMSYLSSDFGIVLLSKKIEDEHKLLANELNVALLSDEDFNVYSKATKENPLRLNSALTNMNCWDRYFDIPNRFPKLQILFEYCKMGFWNENEANIKLRHGIAKLRNVKQEMNPDNPTNMFLFLELASLFSIALNDISIKVFNKYLWPTDRAKFDKDLKVMIWGGFENYSFWNELRNRLTYNENSEPTDLSLPEWTAFVQLMRACLDNPLSTATTPLILKELAFQFLFLQEQEQQILIDDFTYLAYLTQKDPNATKYAILVIDYLVKASKLPKEFSNITTNMLMKAQRNKD